MMLTNYDWVFNDWDRTHDMLDFGWAHCTHNGLPYVSFWLIMPDNAVVVRCDPCSLDQSRVAYAAMVRADLEKAIARNSG